MTMRPAEAKRSITTAGPGDIGAMQAIERDAARAYLASPQHAFCADLPVRDTAEHLRCQADGRALLALLNEAPIGFLLLLPVDGCAHILEAAVALQAQGRGIGGALFEAAELWARRAGFPEMTLTTYRDIAWNAPSYERRGYRTFQPERDRPELQTLINEETASGFAAAARVAMRKPLITV